MFSVANQLCSYKTMQSEFCFCVVVHQTPMYVPACGIRVQCWIRERPMRVWSRSAPVGPFTKTLNHIKNVSKGTVVTPYAEHPYMTCGFQVMLVSMHKWLIENRL